MAAFKCFMLRETDRVARWLRRFTSAAEVGVRLCEPRGMHEAAVRIEDGPLIWSHDRTSICTDPMLWPADDPRWPEKCDACDYRFPDNTGGQMFYLKIWLMPDGREVTVHPHRWPGMDKAPPGAMWYFDWNQNWRGPDGRTLYCMTPAGEWCIDGPSSGGDCKPWTRIGTPPLVTANPSIVCSNYHGWLRNGELVDA